MAALKLVLVSESKVFWRVERTLGGARGQCVYYKVKLDIERPLAAQGVGSPEMTYCLNLLWI